MTCSECKFWTQPQAMPMPQGLGQCRRNAPVALPAPPGMPMMQAPAGVIWPVTMPTDSCGQFEAKQT